MHHECILTEIYNKHSCASSQMQQMLIFCPSLFYKDKERFYLLFLIMSSLGLTGVTITCHMLTFVCILCFYIFTYIPTQIHTHTWEIETSNSQVYKHSFVLFWSNI